MKVSTFSCEVMLPRPTSITRLQSAFVSAPSYTRSLLGSPYGYFEQNFVNGPLSGKFDRSFLSSVFLNVTNLKFIRADGRVSERRLCRLEGHLRCGLSPVSHDCWEHRGA
jgi:hypothetical protein